MLGVHLLRAMITHAFSVRTQFDKENPGVQRLDNLAKNNEVTTATSTIGDEKQWNVFMRLGSESVRCAVMFSLTNPFPLGYRQYI